MQKYSIISVPDLVNKLWAKIVCAHIFDFLMFFNGGSFLYDLDQ